MVEKTTLPIRNFDGGLNLKENSALIENNEFPRFDDLDFTIVGLGGQRKGERRFTDRVADGAVEGLFMYFPSGASDEVIIVADGEIWKSTSGGTLDGNALATPYSAGNHVEAVEMNDLLFLVESGTEMKKYDGSSITKAGIDAPESADQTDSDDGAPNVATGSAGNLSGDYQYRITYISDTSESDPGAISPTVSPSSEEVDLTDIPVSPASEVNDRGVYRTQADGADLFKVGDVGDNSATTFTDDTTDDNLGAGLDTNSGVPTSGLFIIEKYHDFIFAAGDSSNEDRLFYSQQLEPEKWDENNFIDIQSGRDIPITALDVFRDQLYIFKTEGISILTGFSEVEFQVSDLFERFGAPHPRAVVSSARELFFYDGDQSIFRISGGNIDLISKKIEPDLETLADPQDVALAIDQDSQLHVSYRDTSGNGRELLYDPIRQSWTRNRGRDISRYASRVNDTLLAGSRTEGFVHELDVTKTGDQNQFIHQTTGTSETLDQRYTARRFASGGDGILSEILVRLKKNTDVNRSIRAYLYSDNSGEPGVRLEQAGSDIDETNLGSSFGWETFSFSTVQLQSGADYHVVLQISDVVEYESSVDTTGTIVAEVPSFIDTDVSLTSGDAASVNHNLGTKKVFIQVYNTDGEQVDMQTIRWVDTNNAEVVSNVDVSSAKVVVSIPEAKNTMDLEAGVANQYKHLFGTKVVPAQFYNDDGEYVVLDRMEAIDSDTFEVESSVQTSGTLVLQDPDTSKSVDLDAGVAGSFDFFADSQFFLVQFYNADDQQTFLDRVEIIALSPSGGAHSEWQGESGSFSSEPIHRSSDASSWTEDTGLTGNLRVYTDSIPWLLETKEFDLERPQSRKQFRRIVNHFKASQGTLTIRLITDGTTTQSLTRNTTSGGSTLGSFEVGTDALGGTIEQIDDFSVAPRNLGRRVALQIESIDSQNFQLLSITPELYIRRPR